MRTALRTIGTLVAVLLCALVFAHRIEFMSPCAPMGVTLLSARCTGAQDIYDLNALAQPGSEMVTVTVSAAGVLPATARLRPGDRLTFVNADSRPHVLESDCPAFSVALGPGERSNPVDLENAHECGFHERHDIARAESQPLTR